MRDVLQGFAGIRHQFLYLVEVDFAVGVDRRLAVGLAVEHILVNVGIHLDVAALGLDATVVDVQAVLVLVDGAAGVLDLQTAALLAREVLDGHLQVVTVHLKVVNLGIHILHLDVVGVQGGAGLVGLFAGLAILALAVLEAHLAGIDLPGFVVVGLLAVVLGHRMVLAILLGILFAGMLVIHISLIDIQFAHVNSLFAGIDLDILRLGMAHLGIEFVDGGLHVHLEVQVVGSDLVGVDFPGFAGFLVFLFLLLGLVAHLSLAALERGIAHIDLVVIQVHFGPIDFGIIHIDVKVHRAVIGLDLALGALE